MNPANYTTEDWRRHALIASAEMDKGKTEREALDIADKVIRDDQVDETLNDEWGPAYESREVARRGVAREESAEKQKHAEALVAQYRAREAAAQSPAPTGLVDRAGAMARRIGTGATRAAERLSRPEGAANLPWDVLALMEDTGRAVAAPAPAHSGSKPPTPVTQSYVTDERKK